MMALVLIAAFAAETSAANADAAPTSAEKSCRAHLASKAKGEISQFAVKHSRRVNRETVLSGTLNVMQRPPTRPGELTPTHIVAAPYSFECRLSGRRAPQVRLSPLAD